MEFIKCFKSTVSNLEDFNTTPFDALSHKSKVTSGCAFKSFGKQLTAVSTTKRCSPQLTSVCINHPGRNFQQML